MTAGYKVFAWIFGILCILTFIVAAILLLPKVLVSEKVELLTEDRSALINLHQYFRDEIFRRSVLRVGQPIEGYDAAVLMLAFPHIMPPDFHGVVTYEGYYVFENEQLTFIRDQDEFASTHERTISSAGYDILLENIANRLGIQLTDTRAIDTLFSQITADISS